MATTKAATFSEMLNEYLVYSSILTEEFRDQNWLLQNANHNPNWQGGKLIVPWQQAMPSSIMMGGLTPDADINTGKYVRGFLDGYKEAYGSIYFNSRDLFDHGKLSEQNFLKLLPDQLDDLMKLFKQTVSIQVLGGPWLDTVAATTVVATDDLRVNHPERFSIGMKITITDGVLTASGFIRQIDKNTGALVVTNNANDAIIPANLVDIATLVVADGKIYIEGGLTTSFGSLRSMLLPLAQGGSDTFANKPKAESPFAQSVLYDAGGAVANSGDWNAEVLKYDKVLDLIFDAMRKGYQRGAIPRVFIMSYKHYSAALKTLEKGSGAYKNIKPSVTYAGYSEMEVGGVQGSCKLVAIREMNDDWIAGIDTKYLDWHTGKRPFQLMKSPDGLSYFTKRATTGYTYIADIMLAGDFLYRAPWSAVAIYNLPDYKFNTLT